MKTGSAMLLLALWGPGSFEFERTLAARRGWNRLTAPDEILASCRPGMPDLRILDSAGREIPYVREQRTKISPLLRPLDLEMVPKKETSFVIDRGASPPPVDGFTLDVASLEFLKPIVVEASMDRHRFAEIARSSIFETAGIRRLMVRFPTNDRRYFRVRLDDRNSDPIRPDGVRFEPASLSDSRRPIAARPEEVKPGRQGGSLWTLIFPSENLPITAASLDAENDAFSRPARLFERVLFRGEIHRRLLATTVLSRAPGEHTAIEIPVETSAAVLELEVDDGDSLPLRFTSVKALVEPASLLFEVPEDESLRLAYGAPALQPPQYDLAAAIANHLPPHVSVAELGPAHRSAARLTPFPLPSRAELQEAATWKTRRPIVLPTRGNIAYLDLPPGEDCTEWRIVDAKSRQVPYVSETRPAMTRREIALRVEHRIPMTILHIESIDPRETVDEIEISAKAPDYFVRDVAVVEEMRDTRGVTGRATLGTMRWERQPGAPSEPLAIPLSRPTQREILVEIDDGDNSPLTISSVALRSTRRRIDFLFSPGEHLWLLSGNDDAVPPRYDLALLSSRIVSSPAERASLAPTIAESPDAALPSWFWPVVVISGVLVALAVARTIRPAGAPNRPA